jgi:hypothetical protein
MGGEKVSRKLVSPLRAFTVNDMSFHAEGGGRRRERAMQTSSSEGDGRELKTEGGGRAKGESSRHRAGGAASNCCLGRHGERGGTPTRAGGSWWRA